MSIEEMVEASYYDLPPDFEKPDEYPGLVGPKHEAMLNKGIVDIGLINPDMNLKDKKVRAVILRNIVKLLMKKKGTMVIVRDPEWVLKGVYPGKMVKDELKADLQEALEAMFEEKIKVAIKGKKVPSGFSWVVEATGLAAVLS